MSLALDFAQRIAGVLLFAQTALFGQLVFLAAEQFGVTAGFFLALDQLGVVKHRCSGRSGDLDVRLFSRQIGAIFTFDKSALLANFHLNGARAAGGVGLLDFGGGFLHQRDFFALGRGRAMAGLQVAQQFLLVRLGQRIIGLGLGNPGTGQLLDQGGGGFIQLSCELRDGSGTGHIYFS